QGPEVVTLVVVSGGFVAEALPIRVRIHSQALVEWVPVEIAAGLVGACPRDAHRCRLFERVEQDGMNALHIIYYEASERRARGQPTYRHVRDLVEHGPAETGRKRKVSCQAEP